MFSTFSVRGDGDVPPSARRRPPHVMQACTRCHRNRIKCDDERPCRSCRETRSPCFDRSLNARATARVAVDRPRPRSHIEGLPAESLGASTNTGSDSTQSAREYEGQRPPEANSCPDQSTGSWQLFVQHFNSAIRSGKSCPDDYDENLLTLSPSPPPVSFSGTTPLDTLDKAAEERLLTAFLQSYQVIAPIISASWLWKYHAHLWSHGPARQPCHFLDILLALSVHQAISLADDDANDPYQMGGPPGYYYFESHTSARNADMMDPQNVPPFMERVNSVIVRARTCLALQALDNVLSTIASIPHLVPRQSSQDLIKVALQKSSESMQIFERISDTESFVQVTKLAQLVRDASESCSLYPSNRSRSNKGSSFDNLTEFCGITAAAVKSSIIPIHVWAWLATNGIERSRTENQPGRF
ncbi:uncharacterized protein LMH87_007949 [Akanthomyces muscarius]|uniref:Zn(2)-C6 fungal-type domain-containing protein n=1 Tax=Akanthomyces muscarius TaxID=2231603 RepID=A0A9W8QKZ1_AKAMU|nr:uncharacterized protein LMH87_007949 [Akanthomyces muscarius]KAJ4160015.1 hypothetical protein LMH87_007949 [Akanthomyces muscarius]